MRSAHGEGESASQSDSVQRGKSSSIQTDGGEERRFQLRAMCPYTPVKKAQFPSIFFLFRRP